MSVTAEEIAYLSYQVRQLELERNATKKPSQKEALTARLRILKATLDPKLDAFAKQQREKQSQLVVDRDIENEDIGPEHMVKALHEYVKELMLKSDVRTYLRTDKPLSIAGQHDGNMYVVHIEKEKPDGVSK